jgi:hypothetical protein
MVPLGKVYSWDCFEIRKAGGTGLPHCLAEHKNEIYEEQKKGIGYFLRDR